MNKVIKVTDVIDAQVLRDREIWNDLLDSSWHFISYYIGKSFDLPIYRFRHYGNDLGTPVIAIKQPTGASKYYHPLGCLYTKGRTVLDERIMVKLIRFAEEQMQPRKKPYTGGCDIFQYMLQEVSIEIVSQMLESTDNSPEVTGVITSLIERVKTGM